jgi:hypothetical protein
MSSKSDSSSNSSVNRLQELYKGGLSIVDDKLALMIYTSWVNDDERVLCNLCSTVFTLFNRRHHCRACGEIYCNACSSESGLVAQSTDGVGSGLVVVSSRICKKCKNKYGKILMFLFSPHFCRYLCLDDPPFSTIYALVTITAPPFH